MISRRSTLGGVLVAPLVVRSVQAAEKPLVVMASFLG